MKRFLGLVIKTAKEERQHDQLLDLALQRALEAQAAKRETERLLVLLSEPLKDWDLADFPEEPQRLRLMAQRGPALTMGGTDLDYLASVLDAYRLTASAVAPIRAGRVVDDQAHQRGWDDQPLPTTPTEKPRRPLP